MSMKGAHDGSAGSVSLLVVPRHDPNVLSKPSIPAESRGRYNAPSDAHSFTVMLTSRVTREADGCITSNRTVSLAAMEVRFNELMMPVRRALAHASTVVVRLCGSGSGSGDGPVSRRPSIGGGEGGRVICTVKEMRC